MTLRIRVEPPEGEPFERDLTPPEIVVGRAASAGLVVADASVSRQHIRLSEHDGHWRVEDLGTTNGTLLNGKRLAGQVPVKAGDRLRLGDTSIVVEPNQAAVVYDKTSAEAPERQAARMRTLNEIHRALATPISLSELLDLILERCFDVLRPEEGVILLRNAAGEFTPAASRRIEGMKSEVFISRRIVDEVIGKGKPARVVDASVDERFSGSESIMASGVRSVLAAPLTDAEGTLGMIALCSRVTVKQFSQEDMDLLESLASAAVLRVRNVALAEERAARRVLERELSLAHDMQMSMLPRRMPERPEIDVAAALKPARSVGGDLYDFVLDGDRLWFIVADVSGKGMAAALYMAVAKTLFRAAVQAETELPTVLALMNRELCRDNDQLMFVTAVVGRLALASGEVALADAGHNPAVLIGRDGRIVQPALAKGVALGVVEDHAYAEYTFTLVSGETLLLYTDGATDARNSAGNIYGLDRLHHAIAACTSERAQALVNGIAGAVDAFAAGAAPEDDLTLLAIRYRGGARS